MSLIDKEKLKDLRSNILKVCETAWSKSHEQKNQSYHHQFPIFTLVVAFSDMRRSILATRCIGEKQKMHEVYSLS